MSAMSPNFEWRTDEVNMSGGYGNDWCSGRHGRLSKAAWNISSTTGIAQSCYIACGHAWPAYKSHFTSSVYTAMSSASQHYHACFIYYINCNSINNVGGQHIDGFLLFLAACYELTFILCFACFILLFFVANKLLSFFRHRMCSIFC